MLRLIGSGPTTATASPATRHAARARASWHDLTADLLQRIAGYLDDTAVRALATADRRNYDVGQIRDRVHAARLGG